MLKMLILVWNRTKNDGIYRHRLTWRNSRNCNLPSQKNNYLMSWRREIKKMIKELSKKELNERLEWLVNNSIEYRKLLKQGQD